MYQIGNIYVISAIAIMGGGLFGFDISAMSAMYVCIYKLPSNLVSVLTHTTVSLVKRTNAISTKRPSLIKVSAWDRARRLRVESRRRCLVVPGWVLSSLDT